MPDARPVETAATWYAVINPYGGRPAAFYPTRAMAERHASLFFTLTGAEIVPLELRYADPGIHQPGSLARAC